MKANRRLRSNTIACLAMVVAVGTALLASAAYGAQGDRYTQHNLVSDENGVADNQDTTLVNAWGIAFNPFGPAWVNSNGAGGGVSNVYDGTGTRRLQVTIPPAAGATAANPTGIVFNGNNNAFLIPTPTVTDPTATAAARFLFVTEDGVLAGWNSGNVAKLVKDNSTSNAVYKGLALSANGSGPLLYATDFHNNKIDVWNGSFTLVTVPGGFVDDKIPANFAPFGIQAINGNLVVTYAMQDADAHDDVPGKGLGYVDIFDPNGNLLQRFASKGRLNSPWGVALAPAGFGKFSGRLLIGNFGDGRINAYDLATGDFKGELEDANGRPLVIDGLWGLAFGSGFAGQPVTTLYFAAGPNGETDGLFGSLVPVSGN